MPDQTSPLLSILMPSYNSGQFLAEAIESALASEQVELIVQDGLSRDETSQVLRRYADDSRVKVCQERDQGQADALNKALAQATSDWIGWLNADDFYIKGSLEAVLKAIQTHGAEGYSILYGDYLLVDRAGRTLRAYRVGPWSFERIYRHGCYMFSGATFLKRDLLQRIGGLDSGLHFCMDLDLFLRVGPEVRSLKLERPLAALRIHDGSKSVAKGRQFASEALRVRRRYRRGCMAQMIRLRAYIHTLLFVSAQPIRFSRAYSRVRREKQL
jgi:glycosyltransferase involved in cell wall biosynthesis